MFELNPLDKNYLDSESHQNFRSSRSFWTVQGLDFRLNYNDLKSGKWYRNASIKLVNILLILGSYT